MSTIVVHPSYFPSIAQMVAIAQATKVIFEVEDNYQKQTYRNRCYIAHNNGKLSLNIPIKHSKNRVRLQTKNVQVENDFPWQSQHWKSIQTAYRTSPFFEYYEDDLKPLFEKEVFSLLDFNLTAFDVLYELLGLSVEVSKTQRYEVALASNDLRFLINVKKEKTHPLTSYTQVLEAQHGFLPNLSVLDLLCNEGPAALQYLESQKSLI